MKIAILTSGILPVPAVQGGAAENLIDFYLDYNDKHHLHDITVYSVYHPDVTKHTALLSTINHYVYFRVDTFWAKVMKRIHHILHHEENYHFTIEYYFDLAFKQIRKKDYDIILLENRPYYALRMAGKTKAMIICHQHTDTLNIESDKYMEVYNAISKFITVSDFIASRIKTINPLDTKCITVHNGIDTEAFSPNITSHIKRVDIGLNAHDFVVLYSGRVMPQKGISELIEAINILKDKKNIKLLIIGSPFYANASFGDGFIRELKEKAQPVNNQIVFTGYIPYERIPDYLKLADIAAIPSLLNDAFPTTVLEAQAMGLPIITTNSGGIPEQICKENAITIPSDAHFSRHLADAILSLYQNSDKRLAMSASSLHRSKLFVKDVYAKHFLEAISNLTE